MNVIKIAPGHEPVMADINNTLADLQQAVGGYIETVTLPRTGLVVIVNEEGRLLDLPENGVLNIGPLMGPAAGWHGAGSASRPRSGGFFRRPGLRPGLIRACWVTAKGERTE